MEYILDIEFAFKNVNMKPVIVLCFLLAFCQGLSAQKITYSQVQSGEAKNNANVEILGKVGPHYLVFKKLGWRSIVQVFDKNMQQLSNDRLKPVPDNILNADFIVYPSHFWMVYQYQRNAFLYCEALKIDENGQPVGEPLLLDTLRIGLRSSEGVYSTVYSEDKKQVLVYKMFERNNKLHFMAKRYDADMQLRDSVRNYLAYNDRREVYAPLQISNKGEVFFARETKGAFRDNINNLELIKLDWNNGDFASTPIDLKEKFIDEVNVKIDNLNNQLIINALYYPAKRSSDIEGLLTVLVKQNPQTIASALNPFPDSLRSKLGDNSAWRTAFNNFFLKNIFVKRDGSFILVAEDFYSQTYGGFNSWNRWDYLYNNPYSYYDYNYLYSPYRYNRYYGGPYGTRSTTRYFYNDILVLNVDDSLKVGWQNIILKKQSENDDESFLSFGTMNTAGQIHFLFIEREKNYQIISNHGVSPYGNLVRYPTIKSREKGYEFMPRLAKQVGARELIIPCSFRGKLCFAKIEF